MAKMVNLNKVLTCRPLFRPIINQRAMLEDQESPKSPHKLVLSENVLVRAFYSVISGEMGRKVAKLVNLAQIWTYRPLIRPTIHQWVMLEGSESLKSPHKLVLPENVSISAFYTVILGEMGPKGEKLVNLAQIWT